MPYIKDVFHNSYYNYLAIFLIWLFHVSGVIGIVLGYSEFFIPKSQINLILCFILIYLGHRIVVSGDGWVFLLPFVIGMFSEIVGVATGYPFGMYTYGDNLGIKFLDVPILIGINWALLSYAAAAICAPIHGHILFKSALGAALMVFLDYWIEKLAPVFDYWAFVESPIPVQNYISWYFIGFIILLAIYKLEHRWNTVLSIHLYLAFLSFFSLLAWIHI